MNSKFHTQFGDYIGSNYYTFTETDYNHWYYGGRDFQGFRECITDIAEELVSNCPEDLYNYALEYGWLIADDDKVHALYNSGDIQITDGEALEYIAENHPTNDEIVNYLVNGDFNTDYRAIGYDSSALCNYGENNGYSDIVDMDAIMDELSSNIDILHVGKTWFFDFQNNSSGYLFDDEDDIFEEDFSGAIEDADCTPTLNPEDVPDLEDEVGDTNQLSIRIDYDNRDYACIYTGNDHFIVGDSGQSHTEMLQDWLDSQAEEDEDAVQLSQDWYRVDAEEVEEVTGGDCVAFGHIIGNCIFIDVDAEMVNCDVDEVIDAGMRQGYDKGYAYHSDDDTITRVAKHLLSDEILRLYKILGKSVRVRQVR